MKKILFAINLCIFSILMVSCNKKIEYKVGDIVMNDGTVQTVESYSLYKGSAKPVAVIFTTTGGKSENSNRVIGVALNYSDEPLILAEEDSALYDYNAKENIVFVINQTYDSYIGKYSVEGFYGDFDGHNNFESFLKKHNLKDDAFLEKYPVYKYAEEYGNSKDLGIFQEDWYLPSLPTMYSLYENLEIVNKVLETIGAEKIEDRYFWTSSQCHKQYDFQYTVDMKNGEILPALQDTPANVILVREFDGC